MDELELGLSPTMKRKREPKPVVGIQWRHYNVNDRRHCDDCLEQTPFINGVPVRYVSRAFYQRKTDTDVGYFCAQHHQERLRQEGA